MFIFTIKISMGVHKAIETPERMWELFQSYREEAKRDVFLVEDYVGKDAMRVYRQRERPLSYEGFCNFLEDQDIINNPVHYFQNYEGRYESFVHVCARIKRVIREDQIAGGMVGIYNPSITQRLNGLVEKQQVDLDAKVINWHEEKTYEAKPESDEGKVH